MCESGGAASWAESRPHTGATLSSLEPLPPPLRSADCDSVCVGVLCTCRWCRAVAVGVCVRRWTTRGKALALPGLPPACVASLTGLSVWCACGGRHCVQSLIAGGGPALPSVPCASRDSTPNPLHHSCPAGLDNHSPHTHGPPPPKPPRPPRISKGKKKDNR